MTRQQFGLDDGTATLVNRRTVLGASLALASVPANAGSRRIVVDRAGAAGTIPTLAAALEQARVAGGPVRIVVEPGVYREKLRIDVPGVTIEGAGRGAVLTFDAGAQLTSAAGQNWGTSGSATLTIAAPGVTLRNLTIRNDHDYLARPMQAVALAVAAQGQRTRIDRCRIESYQDTLLLQAATLVSRCRIAGSTDFIFGGGAAWITACEIVSRHVPGAVGGYIAAPSTPAVHPHGLIFADCRIAREPAVAANSIFLGRPWRAGGNMALLGHCAFLRCWMDAHVRAQGWSSMGYRDPAGVQRALDPLEARLFEWRSRGAGAAANRLRRILTDAEGSAMTPVSVLGAWVADKSSRA